MTRELPSVRPVEQVRAEALSGLQGLRQHLIEEGVDIDHPSSDPDPLQRAQGSLAFVLYAIGPIVEELFAGDRPPVNLTSWRSIGNSPIRYVGAPPEVIIPSIYGASGVDIIYGTHVTRPATSLDHRQLDSEWNQGRNRRSITELGNLSRGQLITKFERAIRKIH